MFLRFFKQSYVTSNVCVKPNSVLLFQVFLATLAKILKDFLQSKLLTIGQIGTLTLLLTSFCFTLFSISRTNVSRILLFIYINVFLSFLLFFSRHEFCTGDVLKRTLVNFLFGVAITLLRFLSLVRGQVRVCFDKVHWEHFNY